MVCNISNDNINRQMDSDIISQEPVTTNPGDNYYTIIKDGETKTHAPSCNDTCTIDLTTVGDPTFCNNNQSCCLCSTDLWDNVYTSNKDDMLIGDSIPFGSLPLFDTIVDKAGYSIMKLTEPLNGDITENKVTQGQTDNFKRYFNIPGQPLDESKKYSPSKGYFFNQFNELMNTEHNFPLNEYPNYIQSDPTSYMEDPFYYEECLYNKIAGSCGCLYNSIPINNPPPLTVFKSNNPICMECQPGYVVVAGQCKGCAEHNKVLGESGDCVNCDVYCSDRNQIKCIYKDGQCYPVDSSDKIIRSDCLSTGRDTTLCNVTAYGSKTGINLYHLSNDTTDTLDEFYTSCLSMGNCEVDQRLIDLNEGYINFNVENTNNTLNHDDPDVLQYNMITNEFCKNITDMNSCKQLKQCDWKYSHNKCLVNINHNKYYTDSADGSNLLYHYIPIPTPYDGQLTNQLSTECSGRKQDECIINCSWNPNNDTCLDICDTKLNSDDCLSVTNCVWDDTLNTCSKNSIISCNPPSDTSLSGYSKIEDIPYGQNVSELNFNNNTECKNLTAYGSEDTSNINYTGDAKGFCFDGIDEITPTGCIDSRKINDIQLHKNENVINNIIQDTLNDEPNNVTLINTCNELCEINNNICDDYGVKFPSSLNNTDEGCYLLKSVNWRCSGNVINGQYAGSDCSTTPPIINGNFDWCETIDGNDPNSGGCYLEQINPTCIGTDNPPGCIPPLCSAVDTPVGCTPQPCTDFDAPYPGCIVPECTAPGVPYAECLRTICDENEYVGVTADGFRCTACPLGEHNAAGDSIYDGVTTCGTNICVCPNGAPATDTVCPNNGDPKCAEPCDDGYYFDNNECLEKTCICPNGTPATGTDCLNNGDAKCVEPCSQGYYFDNVSPLVQQCLENTCICNHGTPATNIDCEINGNSKCIDCVDGYHLNIDRCLDNICSCQNGVGATGSDCPADGGNTCISCNSGYHLDAGQCLPNVCSCVNGVGATDTACPVHGGIACLDCQDGYRLYNGQCLQNTCTCANGQEYMGNQCLFNGESCSACNSGYRLYNGQCLQNTCTCANGQEYTGNQCLFNSESCRRCNSGYHLEDLPNGSRQCTSNVCTCTNGTGAGTTSASAGTCTSNGGAKCSSCNSGYFLSSDSCFEKIDTGDLCSANYAGYKCKSCSYDISSRSGYNCQDTCKWCGTTISGCIGLGGNGYYCQD
jgi:hypothetical protein